MTKLPASFVAPQLDKDVFAYEFVVGAPQNYTDDRKLVMAYRAAGGTAVDDMKALAYAKQLRKDPEVVEHIQKYSMVMWNGNFVKLMSLTDTAITKLSDILNDPDQNPKVVADAAKFVIKMASEAAPKTIKHEHEHKNAVINIDNIVDQLIANLPAGTTARLIEATTGGEPRAGAPVVEAAFEVQDAEGGTVSTPREAS